MKGINLTTINVSVPDLRRKLYQRSKDFKKFEDLTEERINTLRNNISFIINKDEYNSLDNHGKLMLYIKILNHLVNNPRNGYNFDEKIFVLIEACDPNCDYLRTYIEFGRPQVGTVEYEQYLNAAMDKTGFKEDNIRKFEPAYMRNVVLKRQQNKEQGKTLSRTPKNK